ncbi:MAG: aminotransferase class I/II-fold pyridoxal phosphate-dependent enzyme [Thermofilum sp.]
MRQSLLSERVQKLDYPIRKFNAIARELEEKGEKVIYLNIGDPLKYDFETPKELVDEAYKAMLEGHNYYASSDGVKELREAIAEKERTWNGVKVNPSNILVTSGVSEALNALYAALVNEGDEVLIPDPSYPLYINFADFYGARKIFYATIESEGWIPDVDDIRRKISKKTKFIIVNNPHNPTGAVYPAKILREIIDVAAEHEVPVVTDEIYDALTFEGEFKSVGALAGSDNLVIGLNGFSKTFLATGWRLGYIYLLGPEEHLSELRKGILNFLMTRLSAVTPLQVALARFAAKRPNFLEGVKRKLDERRKYASKRLNELHGVSMPVAPKGAFYAFPRLSTHLSDEEFARRLLLEEKVFVVYGSGFGPLGSDHMRIVYLPPIEVLEEAFTRIERFVRKHSR